MGFDMETEAIYVLAEVEVPGVELGYLSAHEAARDIDKMLATSGQILWPYTGHRLGFSHSDSGHIIIRTCLMPSVELASFSLTEQARIQLNEMMSTLSFLTNVLMLTASESETLINPNVWLAAPQQAGRPSLTVV